MVMMGMESPASWTSMGFRSSSASCRHYHRQPPAIIINHRFGCITSCLSSSFSSSSFASQFFGPNCHRWSSWQGSSNHRRGDLLRIPALPPESKNSSSLPERYHPSEQVKAPQEDIRDEAPCLTNAETAKTLIEVNSKATLMISRLAEDEVLENTIWPDLPYVTDEHGDIYFKVKDKEDILQTLIGDDKLVQVIIGLNNIDMPKELEISETSDFDFGIEELTSEDSDTDDDYDEDVFTTLEDEEDEEDEEDDMISSETSSDWAKLETMRSSHPMYFASKISEVVSNVSLDWMDQPSASIVVQGLLRPAFVEEHNRVKNKLPIGYTSNDVHHLGEVQDNIEENLEEDQSSCGRTVFYKLELISIHLASADGTQSSINLQDFRKARPDVIVHSAANIISRLKGGGEKTIQALKSLCWRERKIQVEEVALTWVDSLGFDLRICSGTQVQTLRFAFNSRATSEFNAEGQLHDVLFPLCP